ncbi:CRISPR-associated protein [Thiorhodovibrio winogradskyi]|uniref:CRISPR-associated protein n=1 Tax=Thiorhodovibrio winogradskyi TaxID=77007 RepID=A0ABZ0SC54_9GAMM|nr:TIGR02710 family CRISPR-associated CARF protein [Thiorhodovibrio winogradskyi]
MTQPILLCTVGGSHQPILTAIRELQPVFVLFFASGRDQATGQPGSMVTITGKGHPVEVRRGAEVVDHLPNIPTQAGLREEQFQAVEVPTDDLDQAVAAMTSAITAIAERFPQARLIADYTGGTKTMTAALVMAAIDNDRVELQLITGNRADLIKVRDGSQAGLAVSSEEIRLRRAMRAYLNAWDRFDHAEAAALLEVYRPRLVKDAGEVAVPLFQALKYLNAVQDSPQRTPARLWDLWLNAQRRAVQCRYDDAVARAYRLLEWTAQWLLEGQGVLTGDLKPEQIPASLSITANPDGKLQAGLRNAWELAAHHLGGEVAVFVEAERSHMLDQLTKRNYSILAHGDRPIARADWEAFGGWMAGALIPLFSQQAARAGLKKLAPQLPQAPLWR